MAGISESYPNFEKLYGASIFNAITSAAFKEKISPMALFFVFTEQNTIATYSDSGFLSFCRECRNNPGRYLLQIEKWPRN